jgi:hypothetical protein
MKTDFTFRVRYADGFVFDASLEMDVACIVPLGTSVWVTDNGWYATADEVHFFPHTNSQEVTLKDETGREPEYRDSDLAEIAAAGWGYTTSEDYAEMAGRILKTTTTGD